MGRIEPSDMTAWSWVTPGGVKTDIAGADTLQHEVAVTNVLVVGSVAVSHGISGVVDATAMEVVPGVSCSKVRSEVGTLTPLGIDVPLEANADEDIAVVATVVSIAEWRKLGSGVGDVNTGDATEVGASSGTKAGE